MHRKKLQEKETFLDFLFDQKLYEDSKLNVVFDQEDAIQEYEKQSLAKSENLDGDKILENSLGKLDHVRKLEVLHGNFFFIEIRSN